MCRHRSFIVGLLKVNVKIIVCLYTKKHMSEVNAGMKRCPNLAQVKFDFRSHICVLVVKMGAGAQVAPSVFCEAHH